MTLIYCGKDIKKMMRESSRIRLFDISPSIFINLGFVDDPG
jgi:hypothetical protein